MLSQCHRDQASLKVELQLAFHFFRILPWLLKNSYMGIKGSVNNHIELAGGEAPFSLLWI